MESYIENGQVYNALGYHLISKEDLLDELAKGPASLNRLVAYRHFLLIQQESFGLSCPEQNLSSGKHFLTAASHEYILLYAIMGFPLNIADLSETQVGLILAPGTIKLYTDSAFAHSIQIITGYQQSVDNKEDIDLAIRARQFKTISIMVNEVDQFYISYDALEPLLESISQPVDWSFLDAIIQHCCKLQENQPELWIHLIVEYTNFLKKLYAKNLINYIPDLHPKLLSLFPQLFPEEYQEFSKLAWKLYHLPLPQAGYYLGFPLHFNLPSRDELIPALLYLSQKGIDGYCDKFCQENKNFMEARIKVDTVWSLFKQNDIRFVNDKDTLHESIFSYSSYDLTIISDLEGRFFVITAPEVDTFIQSGINHWTKKPLPPGLVDAMLNRTQDREIFNLPQPQPLKDLLQQLDNDHQTIPRRGLPESYNRYRDIIDDDTIGVSRGNDAFGNDRMAVWRSPSAGVTGSRGRSQRRSQRGLPRGSS